MRGARTCIYSAIYGRYDRLKKQPDQTIPVDFLCFTDCADLDQDGSWQVIRNIRRPLSPRMRAKHLKILSHRIFPRGRPNLLETFPTGIRRQLASYDYLIWIDGSVQITNPDFAETVIGNIRKSGWTMFSHPDRECIYDEASVSTKLEKYRDQPIAEQVESYRAEGYPERNGLMASGIIGRDARDERMVAINEMWWQENQKWTHQCQISLPVVLWRLGHSCDQIRANIWNNEWLRICEHERPVNTASKD